MKYPTPRPAAPHPGRGQRGLTLTEVLLAFVVSALLLGTAISVYNRVRSHQSEYGAMTTYSTIIGAMDSLFAVRDFSSGFTLQNATPTDINARLLYGSLPSVIQGLIRKGNLNITGNSNGTYVIDFLNLRKDSCVKTVMTMIEQERISSVAVSSTTLNSGQTNLNAVIDACPETVKLTVR